MLKNISKYLEPLKSFKSSCSGVKGWMYLPFSFLFLIPWAIEKYNDKEVSIELVKPIYKFRLDNYEIKIIFKIQSLNLDNDIEPEKILSFTFIPCGECIVWIFDKHGDNWYWKSQFKIYSNWNMERFPVIDKDKKMIICENFGTGSGYSSND